MHVRLNPIIRKELELSQVEIEVQSLRIVAELLGEEADREQARKPGVRSIPADDPAIDYFARPSC